jgi:hypothetical protein
VGTYSGVQPDSESFLPVMIAVRVVRSREETPRGIADTPGAALALAFAPREDPQIGDRDALPAMDDYFVRLGLLQEASQNRGQLTAADAGPLPRLERAVATGPQEDSPEAKHSHAGLWRFGATWAVAQMLVHLARAKKKKSRRATAGCLSRSFIGTDALPE